MSTATDEAKKSLKAPRPRRVASPRGKVGDNQDHVAEEFLASNHLASAPSQPWDWSSYRGWDSNIVRLVVSLSPLDYLLLAVAVLTLTSCFMLSRRLHIDDTDHVKLDIFYEEVSQVVTFFSTLVSVLFSFGILAQLYKIYVLLRTLRR